MADHFESLQSDYRPPLTADDLDLPIEEPTVTGLGPPPLGTPVRDFNDPLYRRVERLLDTYGGVIFVGPPGTSKSHRASEIADLIVDGDDRRQWIIQFHASYQYEDFMFGFVPKDDASGFTPRLGPFLQACKAAQENPDKRYVLVIDELSRADVGRVFGEALTYVERSRRGHTFTIANGQEWSVPPKLVILATMNAHDRGVDEVDAAFERRFAKISMDPDPEVLRQRLESRGVDPDLIRKLHGWFTRVNGAARSNPAAAVGHTYFWNVTDFDSLAEVWEHQLKYLVQRAFRLDPETGDQIREGWARIFPAETQRIEEWSEDPNGQRQAPVQTSDADSSSTENGATELPPP